MYSGHIHLIIDYSNFLIYKHYIYVQLLEDRP